MIFHEWNSVINIYANMNISGGLQASCKFLQIFFSKFTFPMCEMRNVDYVSVLG